MLDWFMLVGVWSIKVVSYQSPLAYENSLSFVSRVLWKKKIKMIVGVKEVAEVEKVS